jgi:hypothetical protein
VRGGSKGGKKSKPTAKPTSKPFESLEEKNEKPISNQIEKEIESKIETEIEIKNKVFVDDCLSSNQWLDTVAMQNKRSVFKIRQMLLDFERHLIQIQEQKTDLKEFKKHFVNWLKKQPNESKMVY